MLLIPLGAYAVLSAPTIWPKTAPDIFSVNVNRNLFRPLTAVKSIEAQRLCAECRRVTVTIRLCENSVHGSTGLTTNGYETLQIKHLAVRPELRRRAPKEFSHSLPYARSITGSKKEKAPTSEAFSRVLYPQMGLIKTLSIWCCKLPQDYNPNASFARLVLVSARDRVTSRLALV